MFCKDGGEIKAKERETKDKLKELQTVAHTQHPSGARNCLDLSNFKESNAHVFMSYRTLMK